MRVKLEVDKETGTLNIEASHDLQDQWQSTKTAKEILRRLGLPEDLLDYIGPEDGGPNKHRILA